MAQIPIQSGVRVRHGSFRTCYPVNLQQKIVESGVSQGELVSTRGAVELATGPGSDRGAIVWDGVHYRVMGDKLCTIAEAGAATELGALASDGLMCRFAYSFDKLAVASAEKLYLSDGGAPVQITDPDLGKALDVTWIDGYFVTTDGEFVVVTELNDPTAVDPLKYGSAESDPDAITGVERVGEDLAVVGRYSIQFMRNVGGIGFPFQTIKGATIPYGCVSAQAKVLVGGDTLAFAGSAKDEPLGVFVVVQGAAVRVSDEDIEAMLNGCGDPTEIRLEARSYGEEQQLLVHTAGCSAALSFQASQAASKGLWHKLETAGDRYRPRNAVFCYGKHFVGDAISARIGRLDQDVSAHFGQEPGWSFDAGAIYNEKAFLLQEVEITGQFPQEPSAVFFSMTRDGETWSREVSRVLTGRRGEHVVWRPCTRVERLAGLHFRGSGRVAIARADAQGEALSA